MTARRQFPERGEGTEMRMRRFPVREGVRGDGFIGGVPIELVVDPGCVTDVSRRGERAVGLAVWACGASDRRGFI